MQGFQGRSAATAVFLAVTLCAGCCHAAGQHPAELPASPPAGSGLYLKVQLGTPLKVSKLKPGDVVEGDLARDVYSADRELFRAGSRVHLTVTALERRRRVPNDHWPWVVNFFTPRHEQYPVFHTAVVVGPDVVGSDRVGSDRIGTDGESVLQVSLVSIGRRREVHAQAEKKKPGRDAGPEQSAVEVNQSSGVNASMKARLPTIVLEAFPVSQEQPRPRGNEGTPASGQALPNQETLPVGTRCKILLLGEVSASKSHAGDAVQARLLEPVRLDSRVVLAAGSLFEGRVVKRTPPRWLSRPGSLYLTFTGLTLPDGNRFPAAASLAGAELDRGSHTRIDAEGQLRGERPGKAWMAINLGVTAGMAKEVDDGTQLVIEALLSTATDASTAGTARIAASCISGIFMITRHGRDVVLPRFTEMEISLDRPLSLSKAFESANSKPIRGGD
jgi:hypothetical protein